LSVKIGTDFDAFFILNFFQSKIFFEAQTSNPLQVFKVSNPFCKSQKELPLGAFL
jgi:hypothetical protein